MGGARTDIPALREKDAEEEEEEQDAGADPSVEDEGSRLIQECLVFLVRQQVRQHIPPAASANRGRTNHLDLVRMGGHSLIRGLLGFGLHGGL